LSQLDLQLTFAAASVPGKNVQNQLRAVDYTAVGGLFDVPLLHRREIAVKNDQRRFVRSGFRANLVQLPTTHECGGVGRLAYLVHGARDLGTGATRQLNQFGE